MKFRVNPFFWQRQTLEKHPNVKKCQFPDCEQDGDYRAPRHDRIHDIKNNANWHWFCLDHVRSYNASWNFYKHMTEEEILKSQRRGLVWDRESWPIGAMPKGASARPFFNDSSFSSKRNNSFRGASSGGDPFRGDPFGLFDDYPHYQDPNSDRIFTTQEIEAITLLGLSKNYSQSDLQTAYRSLVKKHHPDLNGGCTEAENRIKTINIAYELLKNKQY